jgi:hypothetical protein
MICFYVCLKSDSASINQGDLYFYPILRVESSVIFHPIRKLLCLASLKGNFSVSQVSKATSLSRSNFSVSKVPIVEILDYLVSSIYSIWSLKPLFSLVSKFSILLFALFVLISRTSCSF